MFEWPIEASRHEIEQVQDNNGGYCCPRRIYHLKPFKFNLSTQESSESFEHYMTTLCQSSIKFDFEHVTSVQLLRDRIVLHIADPKVRERPCEVKLTYHQSEYTTKPVDMRYCKFCGGRHMMKKEVCPAWGKGIASILRRTI